MLQVMGRIDCQRDLDQRRPPRPVRGIQRSLNGTRFQGAAHACPRTLLAAGCGNATPLMQRQAIPALGRGQGNQPAELPSWRFPALPFTFYRASLKAFLQPVHVFDGVRFGYRCD